MTNIDPNALRKAFGTFMTGVTVVTTVDEQNQPIGFTANSFTSVSLEPPLLLVCPAKSLSSFDVFNNCEYFQISVLAHDQEAVSNIFSSKQEDRFSQVDWQYDDNGCPQINNSLAWFSCRRSKSIDAGDHIIMLGEITDFDAHEGQGLGYGEGGYFSLDLERRATELQSKHDAQKLVAGALVEHANKLFLMPDVASKSGELTLPEIELDDDQPSFDIIKHHLTTLLATNVQVGSVFSIFDHQNSNKSSIYYRATVDQEPTLNTSQGRFCSLEEVIQLNFTSRATRMMIERYINEHKSGNHGLYIGTELQGKTHKISRGGA